MKSVTITTKTRPSDEWLLIYEHKRKGYKELLSKCKWWQFSKKQKYRRWMNYYNDILKNKA